MRALVLAAVVALATLAVVAPAAASPSVINVTVTSGDGGTTAGEDVGSDQAEDLAEDIGCACDLTQDESVRRGTGLEPAPAAAPLTTVGSSPGGGQDVGGSNGGRAGNVGSIDATITARNSIETGDANSGAASAVVNYSDNSSSLTNNYGVLSTRITSVSALPRAEFSLSLSSEPAEPVEPPEPVEPAVANTPSTAATGLSSASTPSTLAATGLPSASTSSTMAATDVPSGDAVVGIAPTDGGYWIARADGRVTAVGSAQFYGSMLGGTSSSPIVGIAARPGGGGYWLARADGAVFAFGAAKFHGDARDWPSQYPVVGISSTPSGAGYWLVAANGGVLGFGDAVRGATG